LYADRGGVQDDTSAVGVEPLTRPDRPTDLREALRTTAEEAYAEIELGLRDAIRSATKTTKVNCPQCRYTFNLQVRDWGSVIRASSELLDRVVSEPSATASEPEIEGPLTPEMVSQLSNAQLVKLMAQARPYPTKLLPGQDCSVTWRTRSARCGKRSPATAMATMSPCGG
jgi:hypothetical protein